MLTTILIGITCVATACVISRGHANASKASLAAINDRYQRKLNAATSDDERNEVLSAWSMFKASRGVK